MTRALGGRRHVAREETRVGPSVDASTGRDTREGRRERDDDERGVGGWITPRYFAAKRRARRRTDGRTESDGRENENERANAVTDGCGAVIAR